MEQEVVRADSATSLGYRGEPGWRDMSDYVVHFTKDSPTQSAYRAIMGILGSGHVEARNPFGCATGVVGLGESQHCACLSEIPLDMLSRLVERRSRYGVGFHQTTLLSKAAGRVWYVDPGTPHRNAIQRMIEAAMKVASTSTTTSGG